MTNYIFKRASHHRHIAVLNKHQVQKQRFIKGPVTLSLSLVDLTKKKATHHI